MKKTKYYQDYLLALKGNEKFVLEKMPVV